MEEPDGAGGLPGLNSGMGSDTGGHSGDAGSGGRFLGAGTGGCNGGTGSRFQGTGTGALRGLNSGTGALPGLNWRSGALSPLLWHRPHAILSSPSAAVQGTDLLSMLTPSVAFSLEAGVVAGSGTLTDAISSYGSAAILSSVWRWLIGRGGLWLSFSVGLRQVLRAVGRWLAGLGTGSGVELARFSWEQAGNGDPFLSSVHSTKGANFTRGPSSHDSALHEMFQLVS